MPPLQLDSKTSLLLLLFGVVYGVLVQESRKHAPSSKPFLFLWVVGGVAGTILLVADIIGQAATLTLALAFILTGTPVSGVTIYYFIKEMEKARKRHKLENPDVQWPGNET